MIDPKSDYWRKNIGDVVFQMMRAPADVAAERLQNQFDAVEGAHILQDPEMTVDKAASILDSPNLPVDKAASIIDNRNLTTDKAASIIDNLPVDKAASISDSPNITSAKIKAILDTGSLTDADKIAALLDGDSLTADDAAVHVNSGIYTDDLMASAFDSPYLAVAKAASIIDNVNLAAAKAASIFDNPNLTADKAASIFDNANLTVAKLADIFGHTNLSNAKATSIFDAMTRAVADLASVFNDADVDAAKAAYVIENTIVAVARLASIFDDANLTAAKLQSILDNTNLTIQKGQEIVDAMSDPSKIGTGGRRGYLGDDWQDNKLTSRDKAATTATALSKIYQIFRPEWTTISGSPTASSGYLVLNNAEVETTCSFSEGAWQIDIMHYSTSAWIHAIKLFNGTTEAYRVQHETDGDLFLIDMVDNVNLISANKAVDTDWHTVKLTRDSDGNFELFWDGASVGTATDTTTTTFDKLRMREIDGYEARFDNLGVY